MTSDAAAAGSPTASVASEASAPAGRPSTAESVLQELAGRDRLPEVILEHRGLTKLKSTYTDALPQRVSPVTGRVHTSYHQAVAVTGSTTGTDWISRTNTSLSSSVKKASVFVPV